MKREGRQHGMVRTYRILPDDFLNHTPRFVNQIHAQPTAGMFTKVSSKPTNHSKSTGLSNSSYKTKRRNNHKDTRVTSNYGVRFSGVSASRVLDSFYQHEEDEDEDQETNGAVDHHDRDLEDGKGVSSRDKGADDIVVDQDSGTVTIGEMVILLEQISEEDWCLI